MSFSIPSGLSASQGIRPCANVLHARPASGGLVSWTELILTLSFGKLLPLWAECKLVVLEAARHSCGHLRTSQGKSPMSHGQGFLLGPPTSHPRPLAPSTQPQSSDAGKQGLPFKHSLITSVVNSSKWTNLA